MIEWKTGGIFKADATKVAHEIEMLSEANPHSILDAARDEKSELHKCFEWDNTKAAAKWRLQQARLIVCNLVYSKEEPAEDEPKVRVFHIIDDEAGKRYEPTKLIVKNVDKYEKMLITAKNELRSFKRKYAMLSELEEIFALID